MIRYKGIAASDGMNRLNQYMPLMTLVKAYEATRFQGFPTNAAHDSTRLCGWTYLDGIYIEPGKAYLINEVQFPENKKEREILKGRLLNSVYEQYVENHKADIDKLRNLLGHKLSKDSSIAPINGVAFHDKGILYRVFPELKPDNPKDTKALTNLKELPVCEEFIPGVFKIGNYLVYAHRFFRRNCAIVNSLNNDFLSRLCVLRDNNDISVKIKLDPDLIGLAGTESAEMEYQYWFGPKFNNDLTTIPNGVTRHTNEKYDNFYSNVAFTEFGWYDQDGHKTLECEEVEDRVNIKENAISYCGCRYVHTFLNQDSGLPTHLDGAIRAYTEDQIIERLDSKIDKAGRNTFYTKLWRIDGDISVALWKELITHFFRDNQLVGEYLGGKDEKLQEFIEEDKKEDTIDPLSKYIPIDMKKGMGLRLFYSKWPKESFTDINPNSDVSIVSYETLMLNKEVVPVYESETITIEKALRKRGLTITEQISDKGKYIRIAHEDQIFNFPVFVCNNSGIADLVIDVLIEFCKTWNANDDDRNVSFSVAMPFTDYFVQVSLAGNVYDFVNTFGKLSSDFPVEKNFHAWVQNFYNVNNENPVSDRHPKPNAFITESKELFFKRKAVDRNSIRVNENDNDLELAMGDDEIKFISQHNLMPVPVYLIKKSTCTECSKDYTECSCVKFMDSECKEEINDADLLELTWSNRTARL